MEAHLDLARALADPLGSSNVVKAIVALLVVTNLVFLASGLWIFQLIPANINRLHLWTLVTAAMFETNFAFTCVDVLVVLGVTRYLEAVWGSGELLKFNLLMCVVPAVCTFIMCILAYQVTADYNVLFHPFSGFGGVAMAYTVGLKQLFGENAVFPSSTSVTLTAKWLPGALFAVYFALAALLGSWSSMPFVFFGLWTGWVYLRFFQSLAGATQAGDASDAFSLASFFPASMQPRVDSMSSAVFTVLVALKCCKRPASLDDEADEESAIPPVTPITATAHTPVVPTTPVATPATPTTPALPSSYLPNSDPSEAERRRARALRALEERLASQSPQPKANAQGSSAQEGAQHDEV